MAGVKAPTWAEINKRTAELNKKLKTSSPTKPSPVVKTVMKPVAPKPAPKVKAPDENFVTRRRKTFQKIFTDKVNKAVDG